eukprot:CAMPEP_0114227876 /NCGR_PEP_ID=MMETSP0058-20121206/2029_1 /TAXON_ID=36894 /ORGANISM="Pyramimonas parkeae, CCMP726" /LENGTH=325 /DNA_ID=CAMNT_0001338757 /DNA_START=381 /DNA_END=1358 /DNA_ORIENTATION=-
MLPFRTPLLQRLQAETVSQITTSLAALRRHESKQYYASAKLFLGLIGMHSTFEQEIAEELKAWRATQPTDSVGSQDVNRTVGDVMAARVGSQTLLRQTQRLLQAAAAVNDSGVQVPDDGGGAIFKEVNLAHMVEGAVPIAQQLCERVHKSERCAEVVVEGDVAATLTCAPSHVSHILMEMLKNALNATAERKKKENASCGPSDAVVVIIASSNHEVGIRVLDKGCGLPRAQLPYAFEFCYSTSASPESLIAGTDAARGGHVSGGSYHIPPPLSGMGMGLPTSRLYARHFGGDMGLVGVENGGAEQTVWLPRSQDIPEAIPITLYR